MSASSWSSSASSSGITGISQKFKGLLGWSAITENQCKDDGSLVGSNLPGFVFHVPELPQGHSRDSMVDMFHAVTEWANENPTAGKRPNLRPEAARPDLLADCFYYPDSPESYESLRNMFEKASKSSVPPGGECLDLLAPQEIAGAGAGESSSSNHKCKLLIDLSDNSASDDASFQQELGHTGNPDVLPYRPSSQHNQFTSPERGERYSGKVNNSFLAAAQTGNGARGIPITLQDLHTDIKQQQPPLVAERISSRQYCNTQQTTQYLGAGLRPIRPPDSGSDINTAVSALPESLRIARIEANARATRRRPVPSRQAQDSAAAKAAKVKETKQGTSNELLRELSLHKPVGKPLGNTEITDLSRPKPPPEFIPYRSYQAYRPENSQPIVNSTNHVSRATRLGPVIAKADSSGIRSPGNVKAEDRSMKGPRYPAPTQPTTGSSNAKWPQEHIPELPYLPASQSLTKQNTVSRLQEGSDQDVSQLTAAPPAAAQHNLQSTSNADKAGSASRVKVPHSDSSFRSRLSRSTARRLLEAGSRFDFDNAFQDAKKASLDPGMRFQDPIRILSSGKSERHDVSAVKTRVQFFEAKTRKAVAVGAPTTEAEVAGAAHALSWPSQIQTGLKDKAVDSKDKTSTADQGFAWPRFSDKEYTDPASEYAAKWKAEKRLRRKGMVIGRK